MVDEEYTDEDVMKALKKVGEKCTCMNFGGTATYNPGEIGHTTTFRYTDPFCPIHGDKVREIGDETLITW